MSIMERLLLRPERGRRVEPRRAEGRQRRRRERAGAEHGAPPTRKVGGSVGLTW